MSDDTPRTASLVPAKWRAMGILGVLFVFAAVWLLWGSSPAIPDSVLTSHRNADGVFEEQGERPVAGPELHATQTRSNINQAFSHVWSGTESDLLGCRSLAILCDSEHLLPQRVALDLYDEFRKDSPLDEIILVPYGESLPTGGLLPDMYLVIDLRKIDELGAAGTRSLNAQVQVAFGTRPFTSSTYSNNGVDPPRVVLHMRGQCDYSATQLGLETGSARYSVVSKELTEKIAKSIRDKLTEITDKHGIASGDPPEFLPEYQPLPEWAFLKDLGAEQIFAGRQLMTPHRSLWRIRYDGAVADLKKIVHEGLTAAGWPEAKPDESDAPWLQRTYREQNVTAELFRPVPAVMIVPDDGHDVDNIYYLAVTQWISQDDVRAALTALLQRDPPEAELLQFSEFWRLAPDLVDEYFEKHPPRGPDALVQRARRMLKSEPDRREPGRQMILRAWTIENLIRPNEQSKHDYKKLFEDAELGEIPRIPDIKVLQPGDVLDLRSGMPPPQRLAVNERLPMLLAVNGDEIELCEISIPRQTRDAETLLLQVRQVTVRSGSRSASNGTRTLRAPFRTDILHGGIELDLRIAPMEENGRYEVTIAPRQP